jgi:hypothetical protein
MPFAAAYLLIAGGVCACSPLFKRISSRLSRFLSGIGFFVGVGIVVVAADITLNLKLLESYFGNYFVTPTSLDDHPYLRFWLPLMLVLGVLLFSRPIRNLRWASLVAVAAGLLAAYYVKVFLPSLIVPILVVAFLVATVAVYALLRFVEDLVEFVGTVLAFPPVAAIIGLASVYFGIVIVASFP